MRRWLSIIVPLAILGAAIVLRVMDPVPIQQLRLILFDSYQRALPRIYNPKTSPVRVVDIDDASLARLGQWPWPRTLVARLIDRLNQFGAAAIALDMVFAEPDRTSPEQMLANWPDSPERRALAARLAKSPSHDAVLARAIARAPVVTGFIMTSRKTPRLPAVKGTFVFAGDNPRPFLRAFAGAVVNLPALSAAATGDGALNWVPDRDLVVRRATLALRLGNRIYPTLLAEALRVAQGARSYVIKSSGASGETAFGEHTGISSIRIGQFIVPTDAHGQVILHLTGPVPERTVPAWRVLAPGFDKRLIAGRIVLIGTSAAGLKDIRATPMGGGMPGVAIHAQAIEQIVAGDYITRPDWILGAEMTYLVALGLLLITIARVFNALWASLFGILAAVAAAASSWFAYSDLHMLIDPIYPTVTALFIFLAQTLISYLLTETERRRVRNAFSRYMSPDLVEQLAEHPSRLTLGGEMREMTLMFCDIRGFTTIAERYDAQGLTRLINSFLTPMTGIILDHRGTIDKYMGDSIMAFWNAPLDDPEHAVNACTAALDMYGALARLNQGWATAAVAAGQPFTAMRMGVGINTGICCVGNLGSEQRFDYSVLGDDVNLASRLESQTKTYLVDIVVGENTQAQAADHAFLEIDLIRVKGKTRPARIFALLGPPRLAADPDFVALAARHEEMIACYRAGSWDAAAALIDDCATRDTTLLARRRNLRGLEELYSLYRARIAAYRTAPPAADWDGVFDATIK